MRLLLCQCQCQIPLSALDVPTTSVARSAAASPTGLCCLIIASTHDALCRFSRAHQIVRYFEGEELSLEMHFSTITAMRAGEDEDAR